MPNGKFLHVYRKFPKYENKHRRIVDVKPAHALSQQLIFVPPRLLKIKNVKKNRTL